MVNTSDTTISSTCWDMPHRAVWITLMTGNPMAHPITPSITHQPVIKPKVSREVSMEMLRSAYVAFMNDLDPRDDLFASVEESNAFHDSMWLFLEESFGWPDYASHN